MDIPKISFDEAKYGAAFEDLDVNKDNVINEDDLAAATDDKVKDTITTVLADAADADPELADDATKGTDGEKATAKTEADIQKAADDLLAKYPVEAGAGGTYDAYSMDNPEMAAFQKAMDGGFIDGLIKDGFSQADVVNVIAKAFPSIGIKNNDNGGFDCPFGHGDAARALYDKFVQAVSTADSPELAKLRTEISELNASISANNLRLNVLKGSIEELSEEVEAEITKALEESEEIAEDQKKGAADIVSEELEKYTNAEGEMTYEQFQENMSSRLDELEGDGSGKLSKVVNKIVTAEAKLGTLKKYLTEFGNLVSANKELADKVKTKTGDLEDAEKNAESNPDCNRCDPIGFETDGKQYDFFVDKDKNGDLSNEQEFLGADKGWSEMAALDTNDDGKVTADEMGDLMVVETDADGNQVAKKAADVFGEGDSINLDSYKAVNKDFENGNTLLGSFSLNLDGKEITNGYNTMDKLDWLDEKYNFTDEDAGIGRFAHGNTKAFDVTDYSKEYDEFNAQYTKLETDMATAWSKIGVNREDVSEKITEASQKSADAKASEIENFFKKPVEEPPATEE